MKDKKQSERPTTGGQYNFGHLSRVIRVVLMIILDDDDDNAEFQISQGNNKLKKP